MAFASLALKEAKGHYTCIEREAVAIVWAVRDFKFYLWGIPFPFQIDPHPLVQLFSCKNFKCLTPRLKRWGEELEEFNFQVQYLHDLVNKTADCLSCLPIVCDEETEVLDNHVHWVRESTITKEEWDKK